MGVCNNIILLLLTGLFVDVSKGKFRGRGLIYSSKFLRSSEPNITYASRFRDDDFRLAQPGTSSASSLSQTSIQTP